MGYTWMVADSELSHRESLDQASRISCDGDGGACF